MRSLPGDPRVGLLLFDEPSAHLDPRAEYGACLTRYRLASSTSISILADLFARLRTLRGDKTMFFSTHRFGNLTRHADLILCDSLFLHRIPAMSDRMSRYMHDSAIVETGTHEQLLEHEGQYAELWKIQAQAFM